MAFIDPRETNEEARNHLEKGSNILAWGDNDAWWGGQTSSALFKVSKSLNPGLGLLIQDLVLEFSLRPGPLFSFFGARSCLGSVKCPQLLLHSIFLDLEKTSDTSTSSSKGGPDRKTQDFLAIYIMGLGSFQHGQKGPRVLSKFRL